MSISKMQKIKNSIGKPHFTPLGVVRNFLKIAEILPFFFKSSLKIPNHSALSTESKNPRNILQNVDLNKVEIKLNHFLTTKGFKDEELRLPDFAVDLGLTTHQASHYLNKYLSMSYVDFLNYHRINEVIDMIRTKSDYNLLNIALECGFNSASSFHRACIKFTGKSPRDLKKDILLNSESLKNVDSQNTKT
ncbi:helix-turn-helix domain-containing protein [Leptospira santarosai]|uniref:helix-turn-helix domain-containing protein n=1 Tax=Leptospira santarosai TaxID=28183 RepID=UPI000BB9F9DA|nr:AraC family transcriptional regulator [Leptospira santarosai]MDO6383874.1 helix-turn-helix domain-containing protein [Leptospira santarosai]